MTTSLAAPSLPQHPSAPVTRRRLLGAVVAGAGLLLAGCGGAEAREIRCTDEMRFEPDTLRIRAGETVTWRNVGRAMVHTATCDPAKALDPDNVSLPAGQEPWDSGLFKPGATWQHTFAAAGEYRYVCLPHELAGMIGTVVVEP